jgi:hypothetical protein
MKQRTAWIVAVVIIAVGLLGIANRSSVPFVQAQNGGCSVDMQFVVDASFSMLGKFDNSAQANGYNPWEIKTAAQQFIIEQIYSQTQTGSYPHDRRWFMYYRADPPNWFQIFDDSPPGVTLPESYGNGPGLYDSRLNQSNAGAGKPLASAINAAKNKLADPGLRAQEPNNKRIVIFINDAPTNMDLAGSLQSRRVYNTTNVAAIGMKNANGTFKTAAEVRQLGPIDSVTGKRTGEPLADTMLAADQLFTYADKINSITLNDQGTHGLPETQTDLKSHPSADLTEYLAKAGNGSKAGVFSVANTYDDLRALVGQIGTQRQALCGPDPSPTPTSTGGTGSGFDPDWRLTLKKTIYNDFSNTGAPITLNNNMGPLSTAIKNRGNSYLGFYPERASVATDQDCSNFNGGNLSTNRYLCLKTMAKLYLANGTTLTTNMLNNVDIGQTPTIGPITIEGSAAAAGAIEGFTLEAGAVVVGGQVNGQVAGNALSGYIKNSGLDWTEIEKQLTGLFAKGSARAKQPIDTTGSRWNLNAVGANPSGLAVTTFSLNAPGGALWKTEDLTFGGSSPVEFSGRGTILAKNVTFKQGYRCAPGTVLTIIAQGNIAIDAQPTTADTCGALVAMGGDLTFPATISGNQNLTMTGIFIAKGNINLPTVAGGSSLAIKLDQVYQLQPTSLGADLLRILSLTSPS